MIANKKCNFCGNSNFNEKRVQYVFRKEEKMLLVNNAPAEVCGYCGEQYFKAAILKKIENDFKAFHFSGRKAVKVLKVPVEEFSMTGNGVGK